MLQITTGELLEKYYQLKKMSSGLHRAVASKELNLALLLNPDIVVEICFDNSIEVSDRQYIVMVLARDHVGSVKVQDNPLWYKMFFNKIIPRIDQLPLCFQDDIVWYTKFYEMSVR